MGRGGGAGVRRFRRILVPHDFSPHADRALRVAADLAGSDGEVVVFHAVVPIMPVAELPVSGLGYYISPEELVHGARRQLERIAKRILPRRKGPKVTLDVEFGDPYRSIVKRSAGMDLIVISTAGRTGLAHLVIGSVAEKVVRHSPIPVLTLRPQVAARLARAGGARRRTALRAT
jgi:nucleotide-binding universal stress UspA family protein